MNVNIGFSEWLVVEVGGDSVYCARGRDWF